MIAFKACALDPRLVDRQPTRPHGGTFRLSHRHQLRHQPRFDFEHGSIGPGMTDVPQLVGRHVCQCIPSCDAPLPLPQGSDDHCDAVGPEPEQLSFRRADAGVSFRVSHFQSPMCEICRWEPDTRAYSGCSVQRERPGKLRQAAAKSVLNLSAEMLFCGGGRNLGDGLCASGCWVVLK